MSFASDKAQQSNYVQHKQLSHAMQSQKGEGIMEGLLDKAKELEKELDVTKVLDKAKELDLMKNVLGTKKPEAKITHVGLKDVNPEFVTYNAKISVTNPYSLPIPIFQITYALKSADRELVSGKSPDPEPLKANHTTELELEPKVWFTSLVTLARDISADWDIDYDLGITFVTNVPATGDITVPISNKGQMKLPTFKDLHTLFNLTKE